MPKHSLLKILAIPLLAIGLGYITTLNADDLGFSMLLPVTGTLDILRPAGGEVDYGVFNTANHALLLEGKREGLLPYRGGLYRYQDVVPIEIHGRPMKVGLYNLRDKTVSQYPVDITGLSEWSAAGELGWNGTKTEMFYYVYDSYSQIYYIYKLEFLTQTWKQLAIFPLDRRVNLDNFTGIDIKPDYTLYDVIVKPNPIHDAWFLINLTLHGPEDPSTGGIARDYFYYLLNYETGQRIFFDNVIPELTNYYSNFGWGDDGTLLTYPSFDTLSGEAQINIMRFDLHNESVTTWKKANFGDFGEHRWVSFLGVNDLLVTASSGNQTDMENSFLFTVSQIIDGEWHDRPFFRLERPFLDYEFTLTADEAERHELSCLFDLALPTQLTGSDSATTLSALPLLTEPQLDAPVLTTLAAQTFITLTGERACTDNVRWQKVMLSDGTTGWVMEADKTQYYLAANEDESLPG
jgi:hypothetical protein